MSWILLAFIVIPILEMIVLIEVGSILGSLTTVFLVFLTAIIGVGMLRWQGISTLTSFNSKLQSGELPAEELVSAVFLVVAGAFLLTPGFVTDTFGFLLLVPAFRRMLAKKIIEKGVVSAVEGFESARFYADFNDTGNVYEARKRTENETPKQSEQVILISQEDDKN